jgi:hypothetical protein
VAEDAAAIVEGCVGAAGAPNGEAGAALPALAVGNLNGLEDACVVGAAVVGAAPKRGLLAPADVAGVCAAAGAAGLAPNREPPVVAAGAPPNNGFAAPALFCPNKPPAWG